MNTRSIVASHFDQIAQEQGRALSPLTDDLPLLESGLDSLCLAIVVTRLEEQFGVDPFTADDALYPVTFGEFVHLYEIAAGRNTPVA